MYTLNIVLYMYSTCACMSACTLNTNYTGTMQDVHKSHTCTCTLNMLYGESAATCDMYIQWLTHCLKYMIVHIQWLTQCLKYIHVHVHVWELCMCTSWYD